MSSKIILTNVNQTSLAALRIAIDEHIKDAGCKIEIVERGESEYNENESPDSIETRKLLEESRSLKPHRGKHRTPQNKYR